MEENRVVRDSDERDQLTWHPPSRTTLFSTLFRIQDMERRMEAAQCQAVVGGMLPWAPGLSVPQHLPLGTLAFPTVVLTGISLSLSGGPWRGQAESHPERAGTEDLLGDGHDGQASHSLLCSHVQDS